MSIRSKSAFYEHHSEDLTEMPAGGWLSLVTLGFVLPAVVLWFGFNAWTTKHAVLIFGQANANEVTGLPALGVAVALIGIGLFAHFRWCWGQAGFWKAFRFGTIFSLSAVVAGAAFALWQVWFGGYTMH